ncbi:MAG TPA: ATP-binding cassette domain-containing protein [Candidatus Udaeobacter sp.]|nr:ATP-binding cassette domain-containing protein [Candidatus Udaeobacter sp.]
MIQVQNLSKRFGPTVAVENVSFEVKRREVVGFLGPNGAGKTTTMRMLTCYLPPDGGTAKIADFDIASQSIEVRKRIGYLPESAPLYTEMGVVDYLDFIGEVRGLSATQRRQRIQAMIDICGLGDVIKKDIGELSKGYKQRVGLAQTLIHDPDVLILDEPTSGLDPNQIIQMRELIRNIGREKTVILSTHILPEVTATCSRVIIIHKGQIAADGTPSELANRLQGGDRLFVTVRGPQPEVEGRMAALTGVKGLRAIETLGEGRVRYEVRVGDGGDPAERIFQMAAEQRWPLSEIRPDASSLEDVFIQLTQADPT